MAQMANSQRFQTSHVEMEQTLSARFQMFSVTWPRDSKPAANCITKLDTPIFILF